MSQVITAENNPFFEHKKQKSTLMARVINVLQGLVVLAFILIVLYLFVVTPNQVSGRSMLPNFVDNDIVLTNRLLHWLNGTELGKGLGLYYQRGDVVMISTPQIPSEEYIIKRIIAIPGDTIRVEDGYVYLNGAMLDESAYLPPERRTEAGTFLRNGDEKTVPEGKYLILGDNRPESLDSRNLEKGYISEDEIIGRVILRIWPTERFQTIGRYQDTSTEYSRTL